MEGSGLGKGPFRLAAETCNATTWSSAKLYLENTDADVIFLEEHHLLQDDVPEASRWSLRRGWKSVWTPAVPGAKADTSTRSTQGGVAIFARRWLGLSKTPQENRSREEWPTELVPGRLLTAKLLLPGGRPLALYGFYLKCREGMSAFNKGVLCKFAEHVE